MANGVAEFEVASVKASKSMAPPRTDIRNGTFLMENITTKRLMAYAYDVPFGLIQTSPDWTDTERYEIAAKYDPTAGRDEIRKMAQALLASRFKLAVHNEIRQVPAYTLTVGKGGPKLKRAEADKQPRMIPAATPGRGQEVLLKLTFENQPLSSLISFLQARFSNTLQGPALVIDKTALQGDYDFTLSFTDINPLQQSDPSLQSIPEGPDLFGALQEQLGLKLDSGREPVSVIVVDRIEKPDVN